MHRLIEFSFKVSVQECDLQTRQSTYSTMIPVKNDNYYSCHISVIYKVYLNLICLKTTNYVIMFELNGFQVQE